MQSFQIWSFNICFNTLKSLVYYFQSKFTYSRCPLIAALCSATFPNLSCTLIRDVGNGWAGWATIWSKTLLTCLSKSFLSAEADFLSFKEEFRNDELPWSLKASTLATAPKNVKFDYIKQLIFVKGVLSLWEGVTTFLKKAMVKPNFP